MCNPYLHMYKPYLLPYESFIFQYRLYNLLYKPYLLLCKSYPVSYPVCVISCVSYIPLYAHHFSFCLNRLSSCITHLRLRRYIPSLIFEKLYLILHKLYLFLYKLYPFLHTSYLFLNKPSAYMSF